MKRLLNNVELSIVLIAILIFAVLKLVLANKFAMLNLYYIPVLLSGYYLGKKPTILTGFLSVLMAVFFAIRWPTELLEHHDQLYMILNLVLWASFLMLVTILIGTLAEHRQRRLALATEELLDQYLRRSIEGNAHPTRVAQLAAAMAREMHLPANVMSSLQAAALLHDLKASRHGLALISAGLECGLAENKSFGHALPFIMAGGNNKMPFDPGGSVIGSRILAVADAFDSLMSGFKTVEPLQILNDMEKENKYDRAVTTVLKRLIRRQYENQN